MNGQLQRIVIAALGAATVAASLPAASPGAPPAERLSETGLYVPGSIVVRPQFLPFSPQYPLWSDGAAKRRWIYLPPGTSIDASRPDAWSFPVGTRFFKQFSHDRPVETRLIERLPDGSWRYLVYVWNAERTDALLAPAAGIRGLATPGAPDGRYDIPSHDDCRACHEGNEVPILGFTALQLSSDRDPLAPHVEPRRAGEIDLAGLIAAGLLRDPPAGLLGTSPRIDAPTPVARAALGYLHANCGHCHNAAGALANLELDLAQSAHAARPEVLDSLRRDSDTPLFGLERRVVPGDPGASVLVARMRTHNPFSRMPPLGTRVVDDRALDLVEQWIRHLDHPEETVP